VGVAELRRVPWQQARNRLIQQRQELEPSLPVELVPAVSRLRDSGESPIWPKRLTSCPDHHYRPANAQRAAGRKQASRPRSAAWEVWTPVLHPLQLRRSAWTRAQPHRASPYSYLRDFRCQLREQPSRASLRHCRRRFRSRLLRVWEQEPPSGAPRQSCPAQEE